MNNKLYAVPAELQSMKNWVVWKYEDRDGKRTKVPYDAKTGNRAKANTPDTWASFREAIAAKERGQYVGVGFQLLKSGLACVDIDHCGKDGAFEPWAIEIVKRLGSYTEISPSGEGLHIWGYAGDVESGGRKGDIGGGHVVEVYPQGGRYITVTGNVYGEPLGLAHIGQELKALIAAMDSVKGKPKATTSRAAASSVSNMSDAAILEKARKDPKHGQQFIALYDHGDISAYSGDHSRADFGLLKDLARLTGKDPARMERLFNASALGQREKWTKRDDYRGETITRAINAVLLEEAAELPGRDIDAAELLKYEMNDEGNARRLMLLYGNTIKYCKQAGAWYVYNGVKWVQEIDNLALYPMGHKAMTRSQDAVNKKYAAEARAAGWPVNDITGEIADKELESKRARAISFFRKSDNNSNTKNYLEKAKALTPIKAKEWDADIYKLNCVNGLLDLKTMELIPHDPGQLVTKVTGAPYDSGATSELWERTLEQVLPDEETRAYIQRYCGYCLTGSTEEENFCFFTGPAGAGKARF